MYIYYRARALWVEKGSWAGWVLPPAAQPIQPNVPAQHPPSLDEPNRRQAKALARAEGKGKRQEPQDHSKVFSDRCPANNAAGTTTEGGAIHRVECRWKARNA